MKIILVNGSTGEIEDKDLAEDDAIIIFTCTDEQGVSTKAEIGVIPAEKSCSIPQMKKVILWDGWEYKVEDLLEEEEKDES